ncbi:HAD hydrolase family protein [Patescibacteria group bacterium]|nr:HAD hydrolase family protein [Patescibacteria group bacterium]
MTNIKGVILDVDGVIVGEKIGINSPNPHPSVIKRLKELHKNGIGISLCTGKPHFAIRQIISNAQLNNLHITDGGGVIINPINNVIIKKHTITSELARHVLKKYLDNNVYVEFYTPKGYFIQKDKVSKITEGHTHVLQQEPILLDNLPKDSVPHEITKIMPIAENETDKERVASLFQDFRDRLTLSWGVHPVILPLQFGIITAPGISKKQGAINISEASKISFENMLGIGDSKSDWQFIELCKYAAAMGNASLELKDLVLTKGKDCSFIGPSVDEHGVLKILDHFLG